MPGTSSRQTVGEERLYQGCGHLGLRDVEDDEEDAEEGGDSRRKPGSLSAKSSADQVQPVGEEEQVLASFESFESHGSGRPAQSP